MDLFAFPMGNELLAVFVFLFGLITGSFLNVCIYRIPDGKSVVTPRSYCPQCKRPIAWYDNIPLLSYLILLGKCRHCGKHIPFQYAIVEFLTGASFLAMHHFFGLTWQAFSYTVFVCLLIIATFVDFNLRIIPDEISVGGMVVGLVLSLIFPQLHDTTNHWLGLGKSCLGVLFGGGLIWITAIVGDIIFFKMLPAIYKMFGKEYYLLKEFEGDEDGPATMGGGDIKLMAMVGAFIGATNSVIAFFIAPFFGAFVGIAVKVMKKSSLIAYGPYLSLASVIALLYGNNILHWLFFRYTIY